MNMQVKRQTDILKGASVSQQANDKILNYLSTFRHSLLRCIFSVPYSLFFCACFISEHKVFEHLVETKASMLSAFPVVVIFVSM